MFAPLLTCILVLLLWGSQQWHNPYHPVCLLPPLHCTLACCVSCPTVPISSDVIVTCSSRTGQFPESIAVSLTAIAMQPAACQPSPPWRRARTILTTVCCSTPGALAYARNDNMTLQTCLGCSANAGFGAWLNTPAAINTTATVPIMAGSSCASYSQVGSATLRCVNTGATSSNITFAVGNFAPGTFRSSGYVSSYFFVSCKGKILSENPTLCTPPMFGASVTDNLPCSNSAPASICTQVALENAARTIRLSCACVDARWFVASVPQGKNPKGWFTPPRLDNGMCP